MIASFSVEKGAAFMSAASISRRDILVGGSALAASAIILPREARAARPVIAVWESEVAITDPHATLGAPRAQRIPESLSEGPILSATWGCGGFGPRS